MVDRRVWDDAGTMIIREGMVPSTVPNEKGALLAWWQEQDAREAAAAVAALIEEEGPLPTDPAVTVLQGHLEDAAGQLALLTRRIQQLEAVRIIDPEAGVALSQQIAAAAIAPAAIAGTLQEATEAINTTAAEAEQRLAQLDDQVAIAVARLRLLEDTTTEAISTRAGALEAEFTRRLSDGLGLLAERASLVTGDKGDQGPAGPGMGITSGAPSGQDATTAALGRPAIAGDLLIDGSDELRPAFRWTGEGWERGPSMAGPTKVVPVSAVVSNNSTTTFAAGAAGAANASSSAGAEAFIPQVVSGKAGPSRVWDSSRWAAGTPAQEVHSALIYVAVVNTKTGQHGSAMVNISGQGTVGFDVSEFAELGELAGAAQLNVTAQMGTPTPPPGGALPAGAPNAMSIFVGVIGPNDYALSGWVLPALKQAPGGKQPIPGW
jgi:uncharacterized coiled-coil protein SlyX